MLIGAKWPYLTLVDDPPHNLASENSTQTFGTYFIHVEVHVRVHVRVPWHMHILLYSVLQHPFSSLHYSSIATTTARNSYYQPVELLSLEHSRSYSLKPPTSCPPLHEIRQDQQTRWPSLKIDPGNDQVSHLTSAVGLQSDQSHYPIPRVFAVLSSTRTPSTGR